MAITLKLLSLPSDVEGARNTYANVGRGVPDPKALPLSFRALGFAARANINDVVTSTVGIPKNLSQHIGCFVDCTIAVLPSQAVVGDFPGLSGLAIGDTINLPAEAAIALHQGGLVTY